MTRQAFSNCGHRIPSVIFLLLLAALSLTGCAIERTVSQAVPSGLIERVTLERTVPDDASVGVISLPLPRDSGGLGAVGGLIGRHPVGWWRHGIEPRRVMTYVVASAGEALPDTLALGRVSDTGKDDLTGPWRVEYRTTAEHLPFVNVREWNYDALRGHPADQTTRVEGEVRLTYGGRTVALQYGATGPAEGSGGPGAIYTWQDVMLEPLWADHAVQAYRVGGIIYNSDTFLRVDAHLLLFANGVAQVASHFVNARMAIDGYDFRGLPAMRLTGDFADVAPATLSIPVDGVRHRLGPVDLNLTDAPLVSSERFPGELRVSKEELVWFPFSRTYNPRDRQQPDDYWMKGLARSVTCTFSLSDAVPVVTRYRAPEWWYALCGELDDNGLLPVRGPFAALGQGANARTADRMRRGRFNAGAGYDDGAAAEGAMLSYYRSGDPDRFEAAMTMAVYWADVMFDHDDFTTHQHVAWPYKTAAYAKFRDAIYAWLETGDPYFLEGVEMSAEGYWRWFRSNWPRRSIGRDNFGMGGYAMLWRMLDSAHARDRTLALLWMNELVALDRGDVGGQMGAGPHPGHHPSLYMTGVALENLLDVAGAARQMNHPAGEATALATAAIVAQHFIREDVEYYPSDIENKIRATWNNEWHACWNVQARLILPTLARAGTEHRALAEQGMAVAAATIPDTPIVNWWRLTREANRFTRPMVIDGLLLGARPNTAGDGVTIEPLPLPDHWPAQQTVVTPFGELTVFIEQHDGGTRWRFEAAERFPVRLTLEGHTENLTSQDEVSVRPSNP